MSVSYVTNIYQVNAYNVIDTSSNRIYYILQLTYKQSSLVYCEWLNVLFLSVLFIVSKLSFKCLSSSSKFLDINFLSLDECVIQTIPMNGRCL